MGSRAVRGLLKSARSDKKDAEALRPRSTAAGYAWKSKTLTGKSNASACANNRPFMTETTFDI
jgi:hypothetical protein